MASRAESFSARFFAPPHLLVFNEGKMTWKCPTTFCNPDAPFQPLFMTKSFVLCGQPLKSNFEHGRLERSSLNARYHA
ncbi:MAG: hypothetical protein CMJ81_17125 [Planctomycetaceae bacterium]|nr:hypothetical protein [Planctomycetaceae bacterium]MBP62237.1 hypothetical protein [Planctomycetaceae bacterium]